ncbi:MAG: Hsp20/alpha crystallin family protein [Bacteroidota bacterium]
MTLVRFQEPRTRQNAMLNRYYTPETPCRNQFFNEPPANISEDKEAFFIELAIPGFEKEDFEITFEKQLLTISLDKETEEQEGKKLRMREFQFNPFKRSFRIGKQINVEGIAASYKNGMLTLTLPKQEAYVEKPARSIDVA